MSVESIEAVAAPLIGDAVKALTPEVESLAKAAEARILAEAQRLKDQIDKSHNGIIAWLRDELANASAAWNQQYFANPAPTAAAEPDPTPAPPAAPTPTA